MASKQEPEFDQFGRATGKRSADNAKPEVGNIAQWLKTTVQRLIDHNHRLRDIREYALDQVVAFLEEIERVDAEKRMAFVQDLTVSIGAYMGGGKGLTDHLDSLKEATQGE